MMGEETKFDPSDPANAEKIARAVKEGKESPTAAKIESNGMVPFDKKAWFGGTATLLFLTAIGAAYLGAWWLTLLLVGVAIPFLMAWAR